MIMSLTILTVGFFFLSLHKTLALIFSPSPPKKVEGFYFLYSGAASMLLHSETWDV